MRGDSLRRYRFHNKEKATHHALWLNFKYRVTIDTVTFGIIDDPDGKYAVCEDVVAKELNLPFLDILPKDVSELSYNAIRYIKMDNNPLPHWESIIGLFSTVDGELPRYILHHKIPLEKFIRHELASRGFDENHRWCGFEKAEEIWLE